jgi:uncharacterized UBP type Zn finger protein
MPAASHPDNEQGGRGACDHVSITHLVQPYTAGCQQCLERGCGWVELWLCLTCGWVACSNDSPHQHAKAHYEEKDHPVAVSLQRGTRTRWCYVHQRAV